MPGHLFRGARGYIRWGEQAAPYFYTLPGQMLIKKSYDERRPAVHSFLGEAADLYPDIVQDISRLSRSSYFRAKKEYRKKGK